MTLRKWRELVRKGLDESVEQAEDRITVHPDVQDWLKDASYEAAAGMRRSGSRAGMEAYHRLSNAFEEEFGTLRQAVAEETSGCGRAILDWQPGDPQQTTVSIDFGREFPVHVFETIDTLTEPDAQRFLTRLSEHLPKSAPFPGKPHRVGGVVGFRDQCVGFRLTEELTKQNERRRLITVYPPGTERKGTVSWSDAVETVIAVLKTAAE